MLKSFPLLSTAILLTLAPAFILGLTPQQATPPADTAAAPAQAPAAGSKAPNARNPVKPTPESQAKAKTIYQIDCAMCHGDNGSGKTDLATSMSLTMGDWTDPKTLATRQDGELFNIIRNGKDKMPPEAQGRADDNLVWNLILYIRGFSKPQPLAPAAK